jgi:hypothetical protein
MQTSRYRCRLDDQPETWVPRELRSGHTAARGNWIVNPLLQYSASGELHGSGIAFSDAMSTEEPTAWVTDPISSLLSPFAVSPALSSVIATLEPGAPLARPLPATTVSLLQAAGILYDADVIEKERAQRREYVEHAAQRFRDGYAALGNLLHPFTLGAARVYFRRLIRQRRARFGDGQSERRWAAHNEPVARFFHHQLTPLVTAIAGIELKPSYVYFSCYEGGADLKWHTDRAQCEVSLSMLLDYSPQPTAESPWPLLLAPKQGRVAIHQRIGEALAYRGCEVPHARDRLQAEQTSMHLFLHYVPADFSGDLD